MAGQYMLDERSARRVAGVVNRAETTPLNRSLPAIPPQPQSELSVFVNQTGGVLKRGYIVFSVGKDENMRMVAHKFSAEAIQRNMIQWVVCADKGVEIPEAAQFFASRLMHRTGIMVRDSDSTDIEVGCSIGATADSPKGHIGNPGFYVTSMDGLNLADNEVEVCAAGCASYSGYFSVMSWTSGSVRVIDGAGVGANAAGPALINGTDFTVSAATKTISRTGTYYIWLQATSTGSTINTPTIESGTALPAYETGKCKILLARVIDGRIIQEHHGAVQGIIWGSC